LWRSGRPQRLGNPLSVLASRDGGAITIGSPSEAALELLDTWGHDGKPLWLQSFPQRRLVRLYEPNGTGEPIVLSDAD
jgi:hypothetical protein